MTNNTKMNCIMVSFSDHYNSTFIDRVPYKYKIIAFQISLFSPHMYKITSSA